MAVIHESPGQNIDKAREHLGTEIINKATTGIQIGFEKDRHRKPTSLITMNVLKLRNGKKPEPFYMRYCEEQNGLVQDDEDFIEEDKLLLRKKADIKAFKDKISTLLRESIPSKELVELLAKYFDCSNKIIRERLKECIERRYPIPNGKEVFYSLAPIERCT